MSATAATTSAPAPRRAEGRFDRSILAFFGIVALVGLCVAIMRQTDERTTLVVNAVLLGVLLILHRIEETFTPPRPMSPVGIVMMLHMMAPASTIIATILQGNVTYVTDFGISSHHTSAKMVALAHLLFGLFLTVGSIFIGFRRGREKPIPLSWPELVDRLPASSYAALQYVGLATILGRVYLLSPLAPRVVLLTYVVRIFLILAIGAPFFNGVALRRKDPRSIAIGTIAVGVCLVVIGTGSRGDGMIPLAFLAVGFIVGRPVKPATMRLAFVAGVLVAMGGLWIGEVLRADQRARTIEALGERVGNLDEAVESGRESLDDQQHPVRRLLRNSTHAVLTMVPAIVPHDPNGLASIPGDFRNGLLPRLNVQGDMRLVRGRNWMLNDLGFLVNEYTSFELSVVADAWLRGGWLGVCLIALLLGMMLQVFTWAMYAGLDRVPEKQALLVLMVNWLLNVEGKDFVFGARTLIVNATEGLLLVGALWLWRESLRLRERDQAVAAMGAAGAEPRSGAPGGRAIE